MREHIQIYGEKNSHKFSLHFDDMRVLITAYPAWQRFLCISTSDKKEKKKPLDLPGHGYHSSAFVQMFG